jgi:hypothetical protein
MVAGFDLLIDVANHARKRFVQQGKAGLMYRVRTR